MRFDARKQAIPIFTMVAFLMGIGVVLQLWLLGASVEGLLLAKGGPATMATVASLVLFLVNGGLLAYVLRVDRARL